jgi:hypothetical protein
MKSKGKRKEGSRRGTLRFCYKSTTSLKDGRKKLEIQNPENVGYCPDSATN